jgi:hypothetical protein
MFSVSNFLVILFLVFCVQEILDRTAIKYDWMEKVCILFSIFTGIFCLLIMKPDSLLRSSDNFIYLAGSVGGLVYFGILRHWLFLARIKRHRKSGF